MKSRIMKSVMAVLLVLLLMLGACSAPQVAPKEEWSPRIKQSLFIQRLRLANVLVAVPGVTPGLFDYPASGILLHQSERYSLVLTAGHVAFVADRLQKQDGHPLVMLRTITGSQVNTRLGVVVRYSAEPDAALVLVMGRLPGVPARPAKKVLMQGDKLFIMGNPIRHIYTYVEGIVSRIGPILFRGATGGRIFIQTSAAIINGNSGCGVYNDEGDLVGMIVSGNAVGHINFAVPLNQIIEFLKGM